MQERDSAISVQIQWPTQFFVRHWGQHEANASSIIEYLYQLQDKQRQNIASGVAPKAKSSAGLFEGEFDLFEHQQAGLQRLRTFIVSTIQQVVGKLNGQTVLPQQINVKIIDAWYHITNDGGFHDAHGHDQCSWCGIYYLQLGESGIVSQGAPNGANRFYTPLGSGGNYLDYGNQYLMGTYIDPPIKEGMLLLFPSFLWHSALPYSGDKDRIVIAFNSQSTI